MCKKLGLKSSAVFRNFFYIKPKIKQLCIYDGVSRVDCFFAETPPKLGLAPPASSSGDA